MKKWIVAMDAVVEYGQRLIGATVNTKPMGYWPGGPVVVKNVYQRDDIVFFGESVNPVIYKRCGRMGFLSYEKIQILKLANGKEMPKTIPVELIRGKEGCCLTIDNYRVMGPKPWAGGQTIQTWNVDREKLRRDLTTVLERL